MVSTLFKNPILLKFWAHVCSPYLLSLCAHLGRKQEVIQLWRLWCYRINKAIFGPFLCTTFKSWCLISAADVFLINWKNIFLGSSRLSLSLRWEDIEPSLLPPPHSTQIYLEQKHKNNENCFNTLKSASYCELWKKEGLVAISYIFNFTYFFKTNLYAVMMRDLFCPDLLTNKYEVWLLWLMIFVNSIWDFIPNKNINLQTWFVQLKLTSLESEKFRINLSIHKESLKTYLINPTTGYFGSLEWLKISNNWIFWLF